MIVDYYRKAGDIRRVDILKGTLIEPLIIERDGITYERVNHNYSSAICGKCAFQTFKKCAPSYPCAKGSVIQVYDEISKSGKIMGLVPTEHYWVECLHSPVDRIDVLQVEI